MKANHSAVNNYNYAGKVVYMQESARALRRWKCKIIKKVTFRPSFSFL